MAATTGTASETDTNQEHPVVTRHGLQSLRAETPSFRPMPRDMPFAEISARNPTICRGDLPIHGSPGEKSRCQAVADLIVTPAPSSPRLGETPNPHRSVQAARGFVLGRFSYA